MNFSENQLLSELRRVRLRQLPWHKSSTVFGALQELGLVMPARQNIVSGGNRPVVQIAVLTDKGREVYEQLLQQLRDSNRDTDSTTVAEDTEMADTRPA